MNLPPLIDLLALPRVWWALRTVRTRVLRDRGAALLLQSRRPPIRRMEAAAWARLVFGLGRRMRGCACLVQSIALTELLRAAGHPATLVLGAAGPLAAFRAHAWVECAGSVHDPEPAQLEAFTRMQTFAPP